MGEIKRIVTVSVEAGCMTRSKPLIHFDYLPVCVNSQLGWFAIKPCKNM